MRKAGLRSRTATARLQEELCSQQLPVTFLMEPDPKVCPITVGLYAAKGTRIIYDRKFLLECRNSPIARTPPCCLPHIPGVTRPSLQPAEQEDDSKDLSVDDSQFVMDI